MGVKQDIKSSLREKTVTMIHGHTTDPSLTNLKKEQKRNAASIPTDIGRGKNGHAGIVIKR